MNDALTDLRDRLDKSAAALRDMADDPDRDTTSARRLAAKCSGVLLALSYVEETIREQEHA